MVTFLVLDDLGNRWYRVSHNQHLVNQSGERFLTVQVRYWTEGKQVTEVLS